MRVGSVLKGKRNERVITIEPSDHLGTATSLMLEHGIGGLPVVDEGGSVVGFVVERDLVRGLYRYSPHPHRIEVAQIMGPAAMCTGDDSLRDVMARMTHQRLRHLVVVDEGKITGIISVGDLIKHRITELETETAVLRDYVAAQRARQ